jgi:hypothetical protein
VPTNKQRRDAARRHLERQLERRQEQDARRRKATLVISIAGTLALIVVIILVFTVLGSGKKKTPAGGTGSSPGSSSAPATSPSASPTHTATEPAPAACVKPGTGTKVTFLGVTVTGATDLKHAPKVTSKSTTTPTTVECQDLVVGKGAAATPSSSVTVQYIGVLYANGTKFDSSWDRGAAAPFSLTGVVPGFTKGIGGLGKLAPIRVGGRRIIIFPAGDGYGAAAQGSIPANSSLVFVVDLTKLG